MLVGREVRGPVPDRCAHQAGTSPPSNTVSYSIIDIVGFSINMVN